MEVDKGLIRKRLLEAWGKYILKQTLVIVFAGHVWHLQLAQSRTEFSWTAAAALGSSFETRQQVFVMPVVSLFSLMRHLTWGNTKMVMLTTFWVRFNSTNKGWVFLFVSFWFFIFLICMAITRKGAKMNHTLLPQTSESFKGNRHQATIAESVFVPVIAFLASLEAFAFLSSLPSGQSVYASHLLATLWSPKHPFSQAYCFGSKWVVINSYTFFTLTTPNHRHLPKRAVLLATSIVIRMRGSCPHCRPLESSSSCNAHLKYIPFLNNLGNVLTEASQEAGTHKTLVIFPSSWLPGHNHLLLGGSPCTVPHISQKHLISPLYYHCLPVLFLYYAIKFLMFE